MKKIIIKNEQEIMNVLMSGRIVKGRLGLVTNADGSLTIEFVAYKRQLNRYFLTSLVFNLQARGIYYPAGKVSQLRLHLTLEGTNKKNSIYKNIVNYPVRLEQRRRLSALMQDFFPCLK